MLKHCCIFCLLAVAAALIGCYEAELQAYDRQQWLPRWSDADGDCCIVLTGTATGP
ncbi:hypothetical protein ACJJIX_19850 [Microbulbifer sp. VAAC004]|uniref:hypothetical protein n=1 Tax=Microbulbifer sp. VAAC004 TaxID=3243385 RepID=UPI00403955C4